MTDTPVALLASLTVVTVAAVVLALLLVRSRQEARRWRSRSTVVETDLDKATRHGADLGARLRAAEAELRHLADVRIPGRAAAVSHPNVQIRGPLGTGTLSPALDRSIDAILTQVGQAIDKERQRVDFAAQATMRGATTTIQALLYQLQSLLQRMQEKYDDPLVAEDLLAADFLNEQALRRIQATAVVCGAWPGLTRDDSHLADIVVGAMSRLSGYERVQVTNHLRDPVGVVARAVEPVAVTLTELMANALHYSHPDLPVAVTLQQGNRGVSVIIDDAGVGMHSDELTRAKRLMSGEETVLLTELGDPPRSGFAAIGQLVRQYGFATHVEASPYGGVRAVVHIPGEPLLTVLDEAEQPMSAMAPLPPSGARSLPGRAATESRPSAFSPARDPGLAASPSGEDLPRRRRRRPVAAQDTSPGAAGHEGDDPSRTPAVESAMAAAAAGAAPDSSPEESAGRWAAFQEGTASGREEAASRAAGQIPAADVEDAGTDEATEAEGAGTDEVAGAEGAAPAGEPDRTGRPPGTRGAPSPLPAPTAAAGPAADDETEHAVARRSDADHEDDHEDDDAAPRASEGNPPA